MAILPMLAEDGELRPGKHKCEKCGSVVIVGKDGVMEDRELEKGKE